MAIKRVGHVVLKLREPEKAKWFYCDVLGMKVGNEGPGGMFLRFNDYHHDIAIFKTADDAEAPKEEQVGLVHVALVAEDVHALREIYDRCLAMGVEIVGTADHDITNSLYIKDPEGNTIEIYAETSYDWRTNGMGFRSKPFDLDAVSAPTKVAT
jgi:catechol 2,3-dioxygenase